MEQRGLGRSGLQVSRLGLGTMMWGRDTDEHEAADQVRSFLDAGGNLLDTANVYSDGGSESVIGRLLFDVVRRDDVVIATSAGALGSSARTAERRCDASRRHLLASLDESLIRMGTDHVDLWQVHAWDAATPIDETLSALDIAVTSGRVRYAGVANYSGWQTARAATWQTAVPGRTPVVSAQVEYSLLARGVERELVPAAIDSGVGVLAWSPLARGVLTGKYRTGRPADSRAASEHLAGYVEPYLTDDASQIVEAVCTAAEGLGSSPLGVALAWVRDQPGVIAAIVGARTAAQLQGILAAESLTLPVEIRAALDDVSQGWEA